MKAKVIPLTTHQCRRLALEAFASEKTIRRAYFDPGGVRESTLLRLVAAAERLGFPAPALPGAPPPSTAA